MKIAILVLCCLSIANAWLFSKKRFPPWNELSVTFGKFNGLPMTEQEAIKHGWTLTKDGCQDSTFFYGKRYTLNKDISTNLLFDSNGQIAGMQFAYPNTQDAQKNWIGGPIHDDGTNYYITAYFTEPSNICNAQGRAKDYVGDNLFLVTGVNKTMKIPLKEKYMKGTKWTKGKCFPTMGQHYWYDLSKDMDCQSFFPFFLLYNSNVLNGFGFATAANLHSSRVEHPPKNNLWLFIEPDTLPTCLPKQRYLSTQHVYLEQRPYLNFC